MPNPVLKFVIQYHLFGEVGVTAEYSSIEERDAAVKEYCTDLNISEEHKRFLINHHGISEADLVSGPRVSDLGYTYDDGGADYTETIVEDGITKVGIDCDLGWVFIELEWNRGFQIRVRNPGGHIEGDYCDELEYEGILELKEDQNDYWFKVLMIKR